STSKVTTLHLQILLTCFLSHALREKRDAQSLLRIWKDKSLKAICKFPGTMLSRLSVALPVSLDSSCYQVAKERRPGAVSDTHSDSTPISPATLRVRI